MSAKSEGRAVDTAQSNRRGHRTARVCVRVLAAATGLAVCAGWSTAEAAKPPDRVPANMKNSLAQRKPSSTRVQQIRKSRGNSVTAPGAAVQVPGPDQPRPSIDAGGGVHDFGTVWVGPVLKHAFKITNRGDGPLEPDREVDHPDAVQCVRHRCCLRPVARRRCPHPGAARSRLPRIRASRRGPRLSAARAMGPGSAVALACCS